LVLVPTQNNNFELGVDFHQISAVSVHEQAFG